MRLYDERNRRLYINTPERERFMTAAENAQFPTKCLCLTLLYTGCRLSEALNLTTTSVDRQSRLVSFRTLKKRDRHHIREVPIPPVLAEALANLMRLRLTVDAAGEQGVCPLWTKGGQPLNRVTGYRWIKAVMREANITGVQASPKGLRHGYGIHALRNGVPLNMLQKWMGHASMATTAIYANAISTEELEIADRMWG